MKAAVLHRFGSLLALEEIPDPKARGDEVAVRVRGAGVCHTDLAPSSGSVPWTSRFR